MRLKKPSSSTPEPRSNERRRPANANSSPAFSYYANRTPEPTAARMRGQQPEKRANAALSAKSKSSRVATYSLSFWLLLVVAAICVIKILFLSNDPKILVVGKNSVTADYVQSVSVYEASARKLMSSSVTNRSKITVDLSGMSQKLQQQYPELQDVSMSVPLVGNRPIVYIQVAAPSLILQTPSGNFALSGSGTVLARLKAVPAGIPQVLDQSGAKPRVGEHYLPSSTVSFARTIAYQLTAAHMAINTFVLPVNSPYELDVRLEGQSYLIRCNLEVDALTQSGAIAGTVQQLGSSAPASYLDVRVPGRVYYK